MSSTSRPDSRVARLDLSRGELVVGPVRKKLRSKALGVLERLAEDPGELVTKSELLETVWAGTFVGDGVLKVCIAEIRKAFRSALGDAEAAEPIGTLHGRGYRLDIPLAVVRSRMATAEPGPATPSAGLVGRDEESRRLRQALTCALEGDRQVLLVTGEAGIGKTTLVEAFLAEVAGDGVWIGRGQCVQRYGAGEPLLPLLEALRCLCRSPQATRLLGALQRHASDWLAEVAPNRDTRQGPAPNLTPGDRATLESRLRVLLEALEAASHERPVLLLLEDLQWADPSTLDLVAAFAERREPARLLLIGTYRKTDVSADHPLESVRQHLRMRGRCEELRLGPLTEAAIEVFVARRLGGTGVPEGLAGFLHRWTEGNPLFAASLLDYLRDQGRLVSTKSGWRLDANLEALAPSVPETVGELIERQFGQLEGPVQSLLEVAAVAGPSFSAHAIAIEARPQVVEKICDELARRGQFLRSEGTLEWPDGSLDPSYGFIHSLYQVALYERVGVSRKRELHQRLGERIEAAYGPRCHEVAAALAAHFERSRDHGRAVRHLATAAEQARRRAALREAMAYLQRERALLSGLADDEERVNRELDAQVTLAGLRLVTEGNTPDVGREHVRAVELCRGGPRAGKRLGALAGLYISHVGAGRLTEGRRLAREMLKRAEDGQPGFTASVGHATLGMVEFPLGRLESAREHLEQAAAAAPSQVLDFVDARVLSLGALSQVYAHLGRARQALARSSAAKALARELGNPFNVFGALYYEAGLHQTLGDWRATLAVVEEQLARIEDHGFYFFADKLRIMQGWAFVREGRVAEGAARIEEGLRACEARGERLARPHFLALLAQARSEDGDLTGALQLAAAAVEEVAATGERRYEPEVWATQGEILLAAEAQRPGGRDGSLRRRAEACLLHSLAAARRQSAALYALRAALGLARLWGAEGRDADARRLVMDARAAVADGVVTPYLEAADECLAGLTAAG